MIPVHPSTFQQFAKVGTSLPYHNLLTLSAPAQAPATTPTPGSVWSAAYFVGLHDSGPIVQVKLTTISGILGHPAWTLDVNAFAGAEIPSQTPFGGFNLTHSFNLALRLQGFFGVGVCMSQSKQPTDLGLVGGVEYQF